MHFGWLKAATIQNNIPKKYIKFRNIDRKMQILRGTTLI